MEVDAGRLIETLEARMAQAKRAYNFGAAICCRELLAELRAGAFAPQSRALSAQAFTEALSAAVASGEVLEGLDEDFA